MIQILPINDTRTDDSWDNSYPYKAISTKALHPIYLNLDKLGTLQDENDRVYFENQKNILKSKDYVDYPEVMKTKDIYFKKIFAQDWDSTKTYDRLGTEQKYKELLGVKVPMIEIPVKPGRNLPIIIEAAAMNERLKNMGYNSAKDFNLNILKWIETGDAKIAYNSNDDSY